MKKLAAILALPDASLAQVTSVFGRTGAVTAQSGDYTCAQVTNCGPVNAANTWTAQNTFSLNYPTTNYPIIAATNGDGIVGPRTQTILQIVGTYGSGAPGTEVNVVDGFAYNGYAQYDAERYDRGGANNGAVQSGEIVGVYSFEPYDGASDATTAAIFAQATETQVNDTNHGTGVVVTYTPNAAGSNKRYYGLTISRSGSGGVTIGDTGYQSPPTDEGAGTLNVASALYADNGDVVADSVFHLRGMAGAGAPSVNNSGTVVAGSTDNRGEITGGTAATNWAISWNRNWPTRPFCTVTPLATGGGTVTVAMTVASLSVKFSSAYNGGFDWVCL